MDFTIDGYLEGFQSIITSIFQKSEVAVHIFFKTFAKLAEKHLYQSLF